MTNLSECNIVGNFAQFLFPDPEPINLDHESYQFKDCNVKYKQTLMRKKGSTDKSGSSRTGLNFD